MSLRIRKGDNNRKVRKEQRQFWGTGNIGNQNFDFGEQGSKAIYFRGTREQGSSGRASLCIIPEMPSDMSDPYLPPPPPSVYYRRPTSFFSCLWHVGPLIFLRIDCWFFSFPWGMNEKNDVHIVWRAKMCTSVVSFIPQGNEKHQLSVLII